MQPQLPAAISPLEAAEYIHGMLVSLRKIAVCQRQGLLAHMLDLAALAAKNQVDQETSLPG
jgi:hypothetical protein